MGRRFESTRDLPRHAHTHERSPPSSSATALDQALGEILAVSEDARTLFFERGGVESARQPLALIPGEVVSVTRGR
jgi:hypothetical protein